jgi:glycosyltransferase involved in cell wall biosynthesis
VKPQISVLLPFHRIDRYLFDAIESIKNSKHVKIEIILIDDRREKVDDEFYKSATCHTGGAGYAKALNIGRKFASNEFVALMNSDDLAHPDRLINQANSLRDSNADISVTRLRKISENHKPLFSVGGNARITSFPPEPYLFLIGSHLANASWMTRNNFWQENCIFQSYEIGADWALGANLAEKYMFTYLNEKLYTYRQHPNQITRSQFKCESALESTWARLNANLGLVSIEPTFGLKMIFPNHVNLRDNLINERSIREFSDWTSNFFEVADASTIEVSKPRIAFLSYLLWKKYPALIGLVPHLQSLGKMYLKDRLNSPNLNSSKLNR